MVGACTVHRPASFDTATEVPDAPRRPDGVAVDLEGSLPPPTSTGETHAGLLALAEPVDISQALDVVRSFFRAISREDLDAIRGVTVPDAQLLPIGSGNGMQVDRHWDRRFRKLDYGSLGNEPLYRESRIETYRYEDLEEPMAGRPLRPAAMTPEDVLVRVPVTRTRIGIDRVFGSEVRFLVRPGDRGFQIQTVYEDFTPP